MKARTRLITVRLTEAEYARLKSHCDADGARSMSEYTRHHLVQRLGSSTEAAVSFGHDLTTIVLRLNQLRSAIQELQCHIDRIFGENMPPNTTSRAVGARMPGLTDGT